MSNPIDSETVDPDFENERAELLRRAAEKPTLQIINATEARRIQDWEDAYPGLALFIEVTKEDGYEVEEGKLIATAQNSIEFLDLDKEYHKRGTVSLTTYGKPLGEEPMFIPSVFLIDAGQRD
jgi:hypothetical protein